LVFINILYTVPLFNCFKILYSASILGLFVQQQLKSIIKRIAASFFNNNKSIELLAKMLFLQEARLYYKKYLYIMTRFDFKELFICKNIACCVFYSNKG